MTQPFTDLRGNTIASKADLPKQGCRWTPNRKSVVLTAIEVGMCTMQWCIDQYEISEQELAEWRRGLHAKGERGLMITKRLSS